MNDKKKRDQILRVNRDVGAMVRARAAAKGIELYAAAEELIAIGQRRVDALKTHGAKRPRKAPVAP
jgi:hypothetical protein